MEGSTENKGQEVKSEGEAQIQQAEVAPERKEDPASKIIVSVAENLGAAIDFEMDHENKLVPRVSIDDIVSKFVALMVYCGANVPSHFAPPYNRVHADVEFWKKRFLEQEK